MVISPTSASPATMGCHAPQNGSNSMTIAPYRATPTLMGPAALLTSSTYMPCPMTSTMKTQMQCLRTLFCHGSGSLWWAPPLTSPFSTMPLLTTMTGASRVRSIATAASILNTQTSASSSSSSKSVSTPFRNCEPVVSLVSYLRRQPTRSRNSATSCTNPRPTAAVGSVSLMDVVVHSSGGVMLLALRSPARSDLPHLM